MARSAYRDSYTATDHLNNRPSTSGSNSSKKEKELWSSLLDNVSSGKKIPEKRLIILGGTNETQNDFLDSLNQHLTTTNSTHIRRSDRSRTTRIPIANSFALGYTYQDVYDSDHEDIVARLSAYTLSSPSPAYAPLLVRLLTPSAIPNTAVTILLDWSKPWTFIRTLRAWIRLLNTVERTLPADSKHALEDNTTAWQLARDAALATSMPQDTPTTTANIPLGPGEYDEPLGLPLLVVCQNAHAVETLEKDRGYRESHFDYILQFLRTVLLKHGAALIYTMPSQPGHLQPLVHTILGIQAAGIPLTGKEKSDRLLRHNVVDRERVLVPPAWDSWGKIRVLREGFDVEGVSRAWGVEIQDLPSLKPAPPPPQTPASSTVQGNETKSRQDEEVLTNEDAVLGAAEDSVTEHDDDAETSVTAESAGESDANSTAALYELQIQDPRPPSLVKPTLQVACTPDQSFFAAQLERLEAYRAEDEAAARKAAAAAAGSAGTGASATRRAAAGGQLSSSSEDGGRGGASGMMAEHIGPVQFNVGGIQYDAEEALRRLRDRTTTTSSTFSSPSTTTSTPVTAQTPFNPSNPNIPPLFPSTTSSANTATPTRAARPGQSSFAREPFTPGSGLRDGGSSFSTPVAPGGGSGSGSGGGAGAGGNSELPPTEDLEAYFASLMRKGQRSGSGVSTPRASGGGGV